MQLLHSCPSVCRFFKTSSYSSADCESESICGVTESQCDREKLRKSETVFQFKSRLLPNPHIKTEYAVMSRQSWPISNAAEAKLGGHNQSIICHKNDQKPQPQVTCLMVLSDCPCQLGKSGHDVQWTNLKNCL